MKRILDIISVIYYPRYYIMVSSCYDTIRWWLILYSLIMRIWWGYHEWVNTLKENTVCWNIRPFLFDDFSIYIYIFHMYVYIYIYVYRDRYPLSSGIAGKKIGSWKVFAGLTIWGETYKDIEMKTWHKDPEAKVVFGGLIGGWIGDEFRARSESPSKFLNLVRCTV